MKKYSRFMIAVLFVAVFSFQTGISFAFNDVIATKKVVESSGVSFIDAQGNKLVNTWVLYNGNKLFVNENGAILTNTITPDGYAVDKFGREIGTYMYNKYREMKPDLKKSYLQKNIDSFRMPINSKDKILNEVYFDAYCSISGVSGSEQNLYYYEKTPDRFFVPEKELLKVIDYKIQLEKEIQNYIKDFQGTNYEIFYQALDKMATTSKYDPNYKTSSYTGEYNNAIAALTKPYSQCHGYSTAIYEIGKFLGIEGISRVVGYMYEKGETPPDEANHAWISFVEDGKVVEIDMTFPTATDNKYSYRLSDPKNRQMNDNIQRKVTYRIGKKIN